MVVYLFIGVAVFSALYAVMYLYVPARLTKDRTYATDKERGEAEDRHRTILSATATAVGAVIAFSYGVYKDIDEGSEKASKESQDRADRLRKDSISQLDSYISRLSHESVVDKTSAIYSMGSIVTVSADLDQTVFPTLLLYVQQHAGQEPPLVQRQDAVHYANITPDVQAAINVLGWRTVSDDNRFRVVDFRHLTLVRPNFHGSTGYQRAWFSGAVLLGADMRYANFEGAFFDGTSFGDWMAFGQSKSGNHHADPNSSCDDEKEHGWSEELTSKDCWWDWMRYDHVANFTGANLRKASFKSAGLSGAIFDDADVAGADFGGADLSRADFRKARNLARAKIDKRCYPQARFPENFLNVKCP
ncbi:pentapeptide repeat-containing protein [Azospirillum sp.]|uniref:pentapeptide repeat-containing protein n=1 Tax=Azospirillum sp. TaxID=34012 RepID=UPI003D73CA3C